MCFSRLTLKNRGLFAEWGQNNQRKSKEIKVKHDLDLDALRLCSTRRWTLAINDLRRMAPLFSFQGRPSIFTGATSRPF